MASAQYTPPAMPPYPASLEELSRVLAPYYQEKRPAELFMEFLVIDVIGQLPQTTIGAIEAFAKKTSALGPGDDWRSHVRKIFNLSNTIDIAILDLWYRNSEKAATEGWTYHPWHFAMNFIEQYCAEGSRVDVWEGDALAIAREHIASRRKAN